MHTVRRGRWTSAVAGVCLAWLLSGAPATAQSSGNLREKGEPFPTPDQPTSMESQRTQQLMQLRYARALSEKIRGNWTRPEGIDPEAVCRIKVRQVPGGLVIAARVMPDCPYNEAGQRSVEAAVLKSQPLPYKGYEAVFSDKLILNFRAE